MKRLGLSDLKKVMATLRGPKGCPWDKKQTAKSLTPYAVEEALELEDAIHNKTQADVMEELGDVLFQVVFQCQMAEERGEFNLDDVIHHLSAKMIERHPHVFKPSKSKTTALEISQTWEQSKNKKFGSMQIFSMPKNFPSLLAAVKIGKKTRTIHFDWYKVDDVFKHFMSEVKELKETLHQRDKKHQEEEVGDALFTLAQVARILNIDPEKALRQANRKIVGRINEAFKISKLEWKDFAALPIEKKERLWTQAKKARRGRAEHP